MVFELDVRLIAQNSIIRECENLFDYIFKKWQAKLNDNSIIQLEIVLFRTSRDVSINSCVGYHLG